MVRLIPINMEDSAVCFQKHQKLTSLGPAVGVHYMRLCVFSSNVDTALLLPVRGTETDQVNIWLLHINLNRG
jgi:hypothetical protein